MDKKKTGNWLGRTRQYSDRIIDFAFLEAYRAIARTHDLKRTNLLDVGCGSGALTREFLNISENTDGVFGCDINEESIEFCNKLNPRINYFVQDALEPLPENRTYDIIIFTTALAQFNRKEQNLVLANAGRQLSPGGYLLILDVNSERTEPMYEHLKKSAFYTMVLDKNFCKRFFGKTPAIMLADRLPFALLEILETLVPGDNILKMILLKARS